MGSHPSERPAGATTRRAALAGGVGAGALAAGLVSASRAEAQLTPPDDRYVWRSRMPVNVKDHGALGDGSTDDSAEIQAAIDSVEALGGGTVYFPPGDYLVNSGLTVDADKPVRLLGAGMTMKSGSGGAVGTRLKRTSGTTTILSVAGTSFLTRGWVSIEDMGIHGGGLAGRGIELHRCQNVYLHRLRVSNCAHNAIRCTQLFNSTGDNLFIHTSGNGTTDPAWLFDSLTEVQGACNTCLFTNVQFEGNFGTDLHIDGDPVRPTQANLIQFTNVKMEAGSGAYPYIKLGCAQHIYFANLNISNPARTVPPIQEADPSSGTRANKFSNVTVDSTGGTAAYAIDLTRRAVEIANLNVLPGAGTTAAIHIGPNMGAGRVRLANVVTSGPMRMVHDERTAVASVASAATITLPPGEQLVRVTGTTGITSIVAEEQGRTVTLKFAGALTVTDGSNLVLAGSFTTSADDTLTLVCDGTNWNEITRSVN